MVHLSRHRASISTGSMRFLNKCMFNHSNVTQVNRYSRSLYDHKACPSLSLFERWRRTSSLPLSQDDLSVRR
eukprot:c37040_g1_i1 orf=65-280(-)